jgi:hypothetical protein
MTKKQSDEPDVPPDHFARMADIDDERISLKPYVDALWSYRRFIGVALLAVLVLFVAGARVGSQAHHGLRGSNRLKGVVKRPGRISLPSAPRIALVCLARWWVRKCG